MVNIQGSGRSSSVAEGIHWGKSKNFLVTTVSSTTDIQISIYNIPKSKTQVLLLQHPALSRKGQ
jgi:hypothetical protein